MAATPLVKKLRFQPSYRGLVLNPPEGYRARLGELPEGATLTERPQGKFDWVHLFVSKSDDLRGWGAKAAKALKPDGLFWVSYPKKSARMESDLSRDVVWRLMEPIGWRPVAQVSIDEVWSAMRFGRSIPRRPVERLGGCY